MKWTEPRTRRSNLKHGCAIGLITPSPS